MKDYFKKTYIVKFTDKRDGYTFLKFGATNDWDVLDRFKHEPKQYEQYEIHDPPIGSIYFKVNTPNAGKGGVVEKYFLRKYPRNTRYFKENFSGITETYKPKDAAEESEIRNEFYSIQRRIYNGERVSEMFIEEKDHSPKNMFSSIRASMEAASNPDKVIPEKLIIKKKKRKLTPEEEAKEKEWRRRTSCDCMFGCKICNPPLQHCESPDPADWH